MRTSKSITLIKRWCRLIHINVFGEIVVLIVASREISAARTRCLSPLLVSLNSGLGREMKRDYAAVQPPSIGMLAPVICAPSSLQRNNASAATCSEVTNSLVGCACSNTS